MRTRATGAGTGGHVIQLPLARVKLIIKTDPDTTLASQEAVLLVAKVTKTTYDALMYRNLGYLTWSMHHFSQATELFISHLAQQAHQFTVQGKRKTLQRRDIDACLPLHDELAFLEGALDT